MQVIEDKRGLFIEINIIILLITIRVYINIEYKSNRFIVIIYINKGIRYIDKFIIIIYINKRIKDIDKNKLSYNRNYSV